MTSLPNIIASAISDPTKKSNAVTARKDDAPAAVQAAIGSVAGVGSISDNGGLIQTTCG
jgi:hypothetical protein